MQTCRKCNASWNSSKQLEQCPFCGEVLKQKEKQDFSSVQGVFRYMIKQYGIDFLYNPRMSAYMSDLAPQLKEEIRLVRVGIDSGAYRQMVSVNEKTPRERIQCFYKEKERLKQTYFLDSDWAEQLLVWLSDALSWGIESTSSKDKSGQNLEKSKSMVLEHKQYGESFCHEEEDTSIENQFQLGQRYYTGYGVKQDYHQAAELFRNAAEHGNVNAQTMLGVCYYNGQGVVRDYYQAVKWYRKAAEKGHSRAQFNLGNCYYKGHGVNRNYKQAVYWYRYAAQQGDIRAQNMLKVLAHYQ